MTARMKPQPRRALTVLLLALAALYGVWFRDDAHRVASLLVFVAPPLLLALGAWRGARQAVFWSGVLGLGWFSHGVMVAWAHPGQRMPGLMAIVLSIAIILVASWPGLRARFSRKA
jgi:uncharacterized membrane protein